MVEFRRTSKVDYHHTNEEYECLMVVFDCAYDSHFRIRNSYSADWIPTDGEAKELVMHLADMSPTFLTWLRTFIQPEITKLHELL